jgi:glycosyltransferase involved in cell wall biosynthesis
VPGEQRRRKIGVVATVPFAINVFMRAHIDVLSRYYDVTLLTPGTRSEMKPPIGEHIRWIQVPFERKISLLVDLRTLVHLWWVFRREKFDAVHSIMPKAGLLTMVGGRLAGVPLRLHTFTGQVWATKSGASRWLLKRLDKVLVDNATRVLADSPSQRQFLIDNGVAPPSGIDVLADGSVAGVDATRFQYDANARGTIRQVHGIPCDAVVFLFVGRLTRDKGLLDLSRAFAGAADRNPAQHLLIVGPDEEGLEAEFAVLARRYPGRVHRAGFAERPQDYMSAADVFCLPSYREGFGAVIIEAASVGLPAIASRIYGVVDAVEDGVTGILHQPSDSRAISEAMLRLAADASLRRLMGTAARERAIAKFDTRRVTEALAGFYREMFSGTPSRSA